MRNESQPNKQPTIKPHFLSTLFWNLTFLVCLIAYILHLLALRPTTIFYCKEKMASSLACQPSTYPSHTAFHTLHPDGNIESIISIEDETYWLSQVLPQEYTLEHATHSGTNGHVAVAYADKLGRSVAIKRVSTQRCQLVSDSAKEDQKEVPHEYDILRHLHHRGIVQVFDVIPEKRHAQRIPRYYDIVMELGPYGDLHDWLNQSFHQEHDALSLMHCFTTQIIDVLRYLHLVVGVVHGDLKLENVLIQDWEANEQCPCLSKDQSNGVCTGRKFQLCDFGASVRMIDDDGNVCDMSGHRFQGTEQSISPETIMKKPIDCTTCKTQDMWSFGCLIYEVLSDGVPAYPSLLRMPPLIVHHFWQLFDAEKRIRKAYKGASTIPNDLMILLKGVLRVDHTQRWTVQDCMNSAWYQ